MFQALNFCVQFGTKHAYFARLVEIGALLLEHRMLFDWPYFTFIFLRFCFVV